MPRRPKTSPIAGEFFAWHLRRRNGVFYADGRGGKWDLGKHSLGTKDPKEALVRLHQLDRQKAIELGLAVAPSPTVLTTAGITAGWERYLEHCGRNQVLGGVGKETLKRYRLIRDRHVRYCRQHGLETWTQLDRQAFEKYGNWMYQQFADRTCYVDLTQIKAVVKWLIGEGLLSAECLLIYPLRKPQGSDTYCYSRPEVEALVRHCAAEPKLVWLAHVIGVLAHTGLRIGELASLRWSDLDLERNTIRVADERFSRKRRQTASARTTKGRRSRMIPIHPELKKLLARIPRESDGLVVHAALGGKLRENNALKIFKEQVIAPLTASFPTVAGEIGFEHGTCHSFRHYFCSQCFLGGASEGEIREWLGHRDSQVVEIYRHLRPEEARRKMGQITFCLDEDATQESATDVA